MAFGLAVRQFMVFGPLIARVTMLYSMARYHGLHVEKL
jgi:hypothetical protein